MVCQFEIGSMSILRGNNPEILSYLQPGPVLVIDDKIEIICPFRGVIRDIEMFVDIGIPDPVKLSPDNLKLPGGGIGFTFFLKDTYDDIGYPFARYHVRIKVKIPSNKPFPAIVRTYFNPGRSGFG